MNNCSRTQQHLVALALRALDQAVNIPRSFAASPPRRPRRSAHQRTGQATITVRPAAPSRQRPTPRHLPMRLVVADRQHRAGHARDPNPPRSSPGSYPQVSPRSRTVRRRCRAHAAPAWSTGCPSRPVLLDGHKVDTLRARQGEEPREVVGQSWRPEGRTSGVNAGGIRVRALDHQPLNRRSGTLPRPGPRALESGWSERLLCTSRACVERAARLARLRGMLRLTRNRLPGS